MLIKFDELIRKHNIRPKGVLHIGASTGQEAEAYYANGISNTLWVEPIPEVFAELKQHLQQYPNAIAVQALAYYVNGATLPLNITNNGGESSSILEMGTHLQAHPDVHVVRTIECTSSRIDKIFKDGGYDIELYDMLNMDIQGAELYALKGMGKLLEKIKYAYIEVNKAELYKACAMVEDIDKYLEGFGFERVQTEWTDKNWGDAFYIKTKVMDEDNGPVAAVPVEEKNVVPGQTEFIVADESLKDQIENRIINRQGNKPVSVINLGEPGAGKSVSMQEPATKMPPGVTVIGKETPPAGTNMDFAKLIREYKLEIRGVVNVGAHLGNDMIQYDTAGIKNVMLLEPHPQIFERLRLQYELQADCRNVALAENAGNLQLYLSTGDDGRSNSLMWPKIHNSQYPNIKYNGQITVLSNTFEGLGVDIGKYNAMHVDVNGYELTAIKGALTFMPHCDFIYTRIYYAELFESNAMVTEVDMYLKQFGFERVHTTKEGQTWGFALYIKNTNKSFPGKLKTEHFSDVPAEALQNQYLSSTPENDFVANVPPQFRPHIRKPVPANNTLPFEEWYYSKFAFADQVENMVYLPVFWNSYYSNHNVQSSGDAAVERLQRFIETLDPEKQYYTICMHPGGILNDTRKLKLKVFGVKPHVPEYHISYVVLPMACQPHGFVFTDVEKDLFISYVGHIT